MEKEKAPLDDVTYDSNGSRDAEFESSVPENGKLERNLKGRHMQMIAIGTSLYTLSPSSLANMNYQVVPSALVSSLALEEPSTVVVPAALYVTKFDPAIALHSSHA